MRGAGGRRVALDRGLCRRGRVAGAVGQALGKLGTSMPGGVYRVVLPRTDLTVTLDGVALKAGFALGGWLALRKSAIRGW